jgi:hypothetical protein
MRKQTNTLSPCPKGFQSPTFSDSDFREVRGLGLERPKSSAVLYSLWLRVHCIGNPCAVGAASVDLESHHSSVVFSCHNSATLFS